MQATIHGVAKSRARLNNFIYSNTGLPQQTRKISNKQSKPTPRGIKQITNEPTVSRKESVKIRVEMHEKTIEKTKDQ